MTPKRPNSLPTIKELRDLEAELKQALELTNLSKGRVKRHQFIEQAEQFIDSCEKVLVWGTSSQRPGKPYSTRTVNLLNNWIDEWSDIISQMLEENQDLESKTSTFLSAIGRFFWFHRRNYTAEDLPEIETSPSKVDAKTLAGKFSSPHREYSEDDLPQIAD